MAAVSLPLRVRERTVGVLRIARGGGLALDAGERRFSSALAYYAALGAERVRLEGQARHAEGLREADRLKDALIASVSHDLRAPLRHGLTPLRHCTHGQRPCHCGGR